MVNPSEAQQTTLQLKLSFVCILSRAHQCLVERSRSTQVADGVAKVLDGDPLLATIDVLSSCPHELIELAHVAAA